MRDRIKSKIKKRLPIFGSRFRDNESNTQSSAPTPASTPTPTPAAPSIEETNTVRGDQAVEAFIPAFVKENKVVLFMKGNPSQPLCGFSATAAGILSSYGKPFAHFDVISDYDVREGVKEFSEWPTLPQIYIGGEFIGGCDILSDMHQNGDLKKEIDAVFSND